MLKGEEEHRFKKINNTSQLIVFVCSVDSKLLCVLTSLRKKQILSNGRFMNRLIGFVIKVSVGKSHPEIMNLQIMLFNHINVNRGPINANKKINKIN